MEFRWNKYYLFNIIRNWKKYTIDKFNNSQSLIMSIEDILYGKDEILNNIVNKIATSL